MSFQSVLPVFNCSQPPDVPCVDCGNSVCRNSVVYPKYDTIGAINRSLRSRWINCMCKSAFARSIKCAAHRPIRRLCTTNSLDYEEVVHKMTMIRRLTSSDTADLLSTYKPAVICSQTASGILPLTRVCSSLCSSSIRRWWRQDSDLAIARQPRMSDNCILSQVQQQASSSEPHYTKKHENTLL